MGALNSFQKEDLVPVVHEPFFLHTISHKEVGFLVLQYKTTIFTTIIAIQK